MGTAVMLRAYLMRHAETESNRNAIYAGRNVEPILEPSSVPALAVAELLSGEPVGRLHSSPIRRAWMTAEILSDRLNLPIEPQSDLEEMEFGPWTGLTAREIERLYPTEWADWRVDPFRVRVGSMETLSLVQTRGLRWLSIIVASGVSTIAVTHESVIKCVLCALHPEGTAYYRFASVPNCALWVLSFTGRQWVIAGQQGKGGATWLK